MTTWTRQVPTGKPQLAFQKAAHGGAASGTGNLALSNAFNTFAIGNGAYPSGSRALCRA